MKTLWKEKNCAFIEAGYSLIFKPTLELKNGTVKGNCDAELVLRAMIDYKKYDKAVVVSGDGEITVVGDLRRELEYKKPTPHHCKVFLMVAGSGYGTFGIKNQAEIAGRILWARASGGRRQAASSGY